MAPHCIWLYLDVLKQIDIRRPQQVKYNLPRHLFTHLGFQSVRAVLSVTLIPALLFSWTKSFRLTDDGRLFPSSLNKERYMKRFLKAIQTHIV